MKTVFASAMLYMMSTQLHTHHFDRVEWLPMHVMARDESAYLSYKHLQYTAK